jgi:phosphate starvation-inducible protein PhoH
MGDRAQRDVKTDGLLWLSNLIENHDLPISTHSFTSDDIVRSGLCKTFVKAFEAE